MQPLQRVVETGLDGPGRDAETLCDVIDGQVAVVAQRDDDLVVRGESCDRSADDVTVLDATAVIAGRERDLGRDVGRQPAGRAQSVPAGIDEDAVEPRLEPGLIAQRLPFSPRLDEGVVGRVLCLAGVVQDRPREAIRLVEVLVGQPDEGRVAESRVRDTCRCAFCQVDGL